MKKTLFHRTENNHTHEIVIDYHKMDRRREYYLAYYADSVWQKDVNPGGIFGYIEDFGKDIYREINRITLINILFHVQNEDNGNITEHYEAIEEVRF